MLKIFAASFALLVLEIIGFHELISYLQPNFLVKILILLPFWIIASVTAWYPVGIGLAGGPDSFYRK